MPKFPTGYSSKSTPVDNDDVLIADSAASGAIKRTKISAILNKILSLTKWIKADKDIDWETFETSPVIKPGVQFNFSSTPTTIYTNTSNYSEFVILTALGNNSSTAPGTQVNVYYGGANTSARLGYINNRGGGGGAILPPGASIVGAASSGTLEIYIAISVSPINTPAP